MAKINYEEYEILKSLDDKWKWIARDEDRGLYAFLKKPTRKDGLSSYWRDTEPYPGSSRVRDLFDEIHLFQFIQMEDKEPYNIYELIKEYENENGMMNDFGKVKLETLDTDKLVANNGFFYSKESEEEDPKYIIDTDDIEISDGNHYLTNLTLTKDSVELPIVGDKTDAIQFDDINQAQAVASYVGGRVEELKE